MTRMDHAETDWAAPCGDIIVMGVSGCGKSTIAQALGQHLHRRFVEGDDLHPTANRHKMAQGQPLSDADRLPWLDRIHREMAEARSPVVISCSALRRSYRDRLRTTDAGRILTRPVTFVHLAAPQEEIAARMAARRGHFMPVSLLDSQYRTLEPLAPEEPGVTVHPDSRAEVTGAAVIAALQAHCGARPA